jgi:hypothetical protein
MVNSGPFHGAMEHIQIVFFVKLLYLGISFPKNTQIGFDEGCKKGMEDSLPGLG